MISDIHPLLDVFVFFFNDTATTEIYTLSLPRRSSDLARRSPACNRKAIGSRPPARARRRSRATSCEPARAEKALHQGAHFAGQDQHAVPIVDQRAIAH